jgi:hypothetical protein
MFAIDRKNVYVVSFGSGHHQFAARYKHFLVRQPDFFARSNPLKCGFEPSHPDDSRHDEISLVVDGGGYPRFRATL